MKQLQLIFDEIAEKAKEKKEISAMYKDTLNQAENYAEICEKIADLRAKKAMIESQVKGQLGKAWEKFEELQSEMKAEKELMNDVAINNLMAGKTVEIKDRFDNKYEPVWSVKFVKVK